MITTQVSPSPYQALESVVGPQGLLTLRLTHFVLWRPAQHYQPHLHLGRFDAKSGRLVDIRDLPLRSISDHAELHSLPARECGLQDGVVYHYWFKVLGTNAYSTTRQVMYCTDPLAWTVDRRVLAPAPEEAHGFASGHPAGVVLYRNERLWICDPEGQGIDWTNEAPVSELPENSRLVIYELPTRWTKVQDPNDPETIGSGTFQDVLALLEVGKSSPNHPKLHATSQHRSHLLELGVNALELLPPADNPSEFGWGYGTANYFAACFFLGRPDGQDAPTASRDLADLINKCHQRGVRFFYDAVMAFSKQMPYSHVNFNDFLVKWGVGDPEQGEREGFGGDLFSFDRVVHGYDPLTGEPGHFVPARQFLKMHIAHWICCYHIDGIRMDSVNNIDCWEFVQEFKDFAREVWQSRWLAETGEEEGGQSRFVTVGEELSVPIHRVHEQRLEGLWNEEFKYLLRRLLIGQTGDGMTFEDTVRKVVDCRYVGFTDGSQAINYVTSHDTSGDGNERIYNYLDHHGIVYKEMRLRLAFACLLTAVGTPMILAGDEFGDATDIETEDRKQVEPVTFERLSEPWRANLYRYVCRLVWLRTNCDALCVNDTEFIHWDTDDDKRIAVWKRGMGEKQVVVVANFSDFECDEYEIPTWPHCPPKFFWREVTESRRVPPEQVGREGVKAWSARVYKTLAKA